MFYSKAKNSAIEEYEKEFTRLQSDYSSLEKYSKILNNERVSAHSVIKDIEFLINSISNSPKEFEKELSEIRLKRNQYEKEIDFATNSQVQNLSISLAFGVAPLAAKLVLRKAGAVVGTKLAIGGIVGAGAKIAEVGVKTLGVASGPVGWAVSGVGTIAGVSRNNKKTADKATAETIKIKKIRTELAKAWRSLIAVKGKLVSARDIVKNQYKALYHLKGCEYSSLADDDKLRLGTLVNETNALSKVLIEKPEWRIVYSG